MSKRSEQQGVTAGAKGARARIERAAATLFAERGADVVTTREIAEKAGASEGALYRHFPSKAALADTLRTVQLRRLADEIRANASPLASIDEQAAAIIDAFARAADRDWSLFCFSLLSADAAPRRGPHAAAGGAADPVGEIETLVQKAMDAGALPRGDAALKAAMATGAILQIARHKIEGRVSGEFSEHIDAIKKSVCAILRA